MIEIVYNFFFQFDKRDQGICPNRIDWVNCFVLIMELIERLIKTRICHSIKQWLRSIHLHLWSNLEIFYFFIFHILYFYGTYFQSALNLKLFIIKNEQIPFISYTRIFFITLIIFNFKKISSNAMCKFQNAMSQTLKQPSWTW